MDHTAPGRLHASACLFLLHVVLVSLFWISALETAVFWEIWSTAPVPNGVALPIGRCSIALFLGWLDEPEEQNWRPLSPSMIGHTWHSVRVFHCRYACRGGISKVLGLSSPSVIGSSPALLGLASGGFSKSCALRLISRWAKDKSLCDGGTSWAGQKTVSSCPLFSLCWLPSLLKESDRTSGKTLI